MKVCAARGLPGCIGALDCQHWQWMNCPIAWAGQFKGEEKKSTFVLEAIADSHLRIWNAFFGSSGSLNDINVLDQSPTFQSVLAGNFSP